MAQLVAPWRRVHCLQCLRSLTSTSQLETSCETTGLDWRGVRKAHTDRHPKMPVDCQNWPPNAWHSKAERSHVAQVAANWCLSGGVRLQGVGTCYKPGISGTLRQTSHCFGTVQPQGPNITHLSPEFQHQWDHAKNAHLGDVLIKPRSPHRVWWSCDKCPEGRKHRWATTVRRRSLGAGCPFCADKAVCRHNSFAAKAPAVAAQFSSKNAGSVTDYTISSNKTVTWRCEQSHEWVAMISHRTHGKSGCPTCSATRHPTQPNKHQPPLTDSQHPLMQSWDWELNNKAGLYPSDIIRGSNKQCHWICHQCPKGQPHRWQAKIEQMRENEACPCCAGLQPCKCNSLLALFPKVAAAWHRSRNKRKPADYAAFSNAMVWWHNAQRGNFETSIRSRTKPHGLFCKKRPQTQTDMHTDILYGPKLTKGKGMPEMASARGSGLQRKGRSSDRPVHRQTTMPRSRMSNALSAGTARAAHLDST